MIEKTMYHVELFTPLICPHCSNPTNQEGVDFVRYMGTVKDGIKTIDPEYPRIICQKCEGEPFKIIYFETRDMGNKEAAEELCRTTNFRNLQEHIAYGNMTQDHVTKFTDDKGEALDELQPRLQKISCVEQPKE